MTTCTNIWFFCFCFCFVCTQCALETGNIHLVYEQWVCKKVLSRDQNVPLKKMMVQLSSRWLVCITEQNTPPIPILSSKLTQATKHRGLFHKTQLSSTNIKARDRPNQHTVMVSFRVLSRGDYWCPYQGTVCKVFGHRQGIHMSQTGFSLYMYTIFSFHTRVKGALASPRFWV